MHACVLKTAYIHLVSSGFALHIPLYIYIPQYKIKYFDLLLILAEKFATVAGVFNHVKMFAATNPQF
jgi:hypothetical protein